MHRSENQWQLYVLLKKVEKKIGQWRVDSWELDQVLPVSQPAPAGAEMVALMLHKDQRVGYRLNLDMDNTMLYVICDELEDGTWVPVMLSADQDVASGCLEADTPVLNFPMPDAIACWIEAFITRHGEVEICAHRRQHVNRRNNQGPSRNDYHGSIK